MVSSIHKLAVLALVVALTGASMGHVATDPSTTGYFSDQEVGNVSIDTPNSATGVAENSNPVDEGDPVKLTGMSSTDDDRIVSYEWDLDNDMNLEATGMNQTHIFNDSGEYKVHLLVTDTSGLSDITTTTVTVRNVPPTAVLGDDRTVNVDELVAFDASNSSDPGADELRFAWEFGDSATAMGTTTSHTYTEEGTYTVSVNVSDGDGGSDTATTAVTVENVPPNADAGASQDADVGEPVSFDGSGSSKGDSSDTLRYEWDVDNDGTIEEETREPTHVYDAEGTYTVELRVTDGDGGSDTDTTSVTVQNVDPTADAGDSQQVLVGETVTFDGSGSSKGDSSDTLSYSWDFDDGTSGSRVSPSNSYGSTGTYTVSLTVTDGDGGSDTDQTEITVAADETDPNADTGQNRTVHVNETVRFDGTDSSDNVGIDTYDWELDDGTTLYGPTPSHEFTANGTYSVDLIVTDEAGNVDTDTVWITVQDA